MLSDTVGLFGGWLISILVLKIPGGLYFQSSIDSLTASDIIGGLIKPIVFGYIIAMVGCYMGLQTTGGTQGVGRSTTQSVVVCSILILAANFVLTKIFFAVL